MWLCIVPPPKAGEQYERTAILYHQQYTSKLGVKLLYTNADMNFWDKFEKGRRMRLSASNMKRRFTRLRILSYSTATKCFSSVKGLRNFLTEWLWFRVLKKTRTCVIIKSQVRVSFFERRDQLVWLCTFADTPSAPICQGWVWIPKCCNT